MFLNGVLFVISSQNMWLGVCCFINGCLRVWKNKIWRWLGLCCFIFYQVSFKFESDVFGHEWRMWILIQIACMCCMQGRGHLKKQKNKCFIYTYYRYARPYNWVYSWYHDYKCSA